MCDRMDYLELVGWENMRVVVKYEHKQLYERAWKEEEKQIKDKHLRWEFLVPIKDDAKDVMSYQALNLVIQIRLLEAFVPNIP